MPTYAKGTLTEFCDSQFNVIAVGDRLRASDGSTWFVNRYLQAVPEGEGIAINKLAAFIHQHNPTIINDNPVEAKPEPSQDSPMLIEQAIPEDLEDADGIQRILETITDRRLAEELRQRGYTVEAKKTVVIEL